MVESTVTPDGYTSYVLTESNGSNFPVLVSEPVHFCSQNCQHFE